MKTLIFDFDGTIADSFQVFIEVFEEITKRRDKIDQAQVETLRGMKVREIMKLLGIKRRQMPKLLIRGRRSMSRRISEVKPIAGLPAVIRELDNQGYKMFILSTNSPENIRTFLKNNKLNGYFEGISGGAGIFNKAKALRKLAKKYRLDRSQCIYIGDEVRDIEAAAKAKFTIVSAGWGYNSLAALEKAGPTVLAKKPRHLPQILRRLDSL